jgi:hypothetical protein
VAQVVSLGAGVFDDALDDQFIHITLWPTELAEPEVLWPTLHWNGEIKEEGSGVNTGIELHTFTGQNCTLWAGVGASRQVAAASFVRDRDRGGVSAERAVPSARWSSAWCRIR